MQFELCIATGFTMVAPEGFEPPTFWFVAIFTAFHTVFSLHFCQFLPRFWRKHAIIFTI